MAVGFESGIHVFFALLSMIVAGFGAGMLLTDKFDNDKIRKVALLIAILVWISWFTVAPVYTQEYGVDKSKIKSYPETVAAHAIGMETKEHIFYTGLILATIIPIIAYTTDIAGNKAAKKLMLSLFILLILGGILLDALGAWISIAAKLAWSMGGG